MHEARTVYLGGEQILVDMLQAVNPSFLLFYRPMVNGSHCPVLDIMKTVHQLLIRRLLLDFD